MTTVETLIALAACILRAEREHPRMESTNDYYWHTREAAGDLARKNGIGLALLIGMMTKMDRHDPKIDELSAPFWNEVQHPLLLCRDVLEA